MAADGIRFVKDGPSMPVELLHRLEEGGLTVFAGAGISRRFNLPDFSGLVQHVCNRLGRPMQADEEDLFQRGAFDAVLGLIERRIRPRSLRDEVRAVLAVPPDADLTSHSALIRLATSKEVRVRLVTTNFDTAFEQAAGVNVPAIDYAPYVPVPGREWNSVVHLHGGLGDPNDQCGRRLVLTSADFGRAYITEGWASKFLGELFRRSSAILFVGYSVSDPAIRYIVDAFAADRDEDETRIATAYILVAADGIQVERTWKSRGVEPIVFDPRENYRLLHDTLHHCADRYVAGLFDRSSIVHEFGSQSPLGALDKDAVSQMTWALNEPTGHTARRFSELTPVAPIAWLQALHAGGVFRLDVNGPFASPLVAPVASPATPALHPTVEGLSRWLCHHLASPELIAWAIENGCHLHVQFAQHVRRRLVDRELPQLPLGPERLWRFWSMNTPPIYDRAFEHRLWQERDLLRLGPWDAPLKDCVDSWLAPTVRFKAPFRFEPSDEIDVDQVSSYSEIEILPAVGRASDNLLGDLNARGDAVHVMSELLSNFTTFLHRAVQYLEYFALAGGESDGTYSVRPSIDEHVQNADREEWAFYIRALSVAWETAAATDPGRARDEVNRWSHLAFPIFRRFVIWTAGKPGGMSPDEVALFICQQPPSTLWGIDTRREVLQYLRRVSSQISPVPAKELIGRILVGPPRGQFREEISEDDFEVARDRSIHLRLAKFQQGGGLLEGAAEGLWEEILARNTGWTRDTSERDEFVVWFGSDYAWPEEVLPPGDWYASKSDVEIAQEIAQASETEGSRVWRGLARTDLSRAADVLAALSDQNYKDPAFWSLALETLRGADRLLAIGIFVEKLPELGGDFLNANLSQLAVILNMYFRQESRGDDVQAWRLWDLVIGPALQGGRPAHDDPATAALNSPIGNLAEALLIKLGELNPVAYDQVPPDFRARLESLLTGDLTGHRWARVVIARAVAWLHHLRPELVDPKLMLRFDWDSSDEARNVWTGFLMRPHITPGFWPLLRPLLLRAVHHSTGLGKYEDQFYSLFAWIMLRPEYDLPALEARAALSRASAGGRARVASYWRQQSDSATEYGAQLYRERLKYLLESVWPLDQDLRSDDSSTSLAGIAICCSSSFPEAVATVVPLLSRVTDSHDVIWALRQKDVTDRFPDSALTLLDSVVGDALQPWDPPYLRELLDLISRDPDLANDPRFHRLDALLHRFE